MAARHEIAAAEPEKQQSCYRPSEDSKAEPLSDLAQIVGARDITIHALLGQVMVRVTGFTQVADHMIGMHIDDPTGKEDERTDDETRIGEPSLRIKLGIIRITRRNMEQALTRY